jgi:hypothetical protein
LWAEITEKAKMFCPSCGKEIPDHSSYCLVCGKGIQVVALVAGPGPESVPVSRQPRFRPSVMLGALLLVAVTVAVVLFVTKSGSAKGTVVSLAQNASAALASATTDAATPKPSPIITAPVPLTTGQIAELATPSMVIVENYNEDGQKAEQGSGYVYSADGVVMTNYHVVRGAASLAVKVPGKSETRVASLLGYDIAHDVAALKLDGSFRALATEETADQTKTGDRVVAIGAPLGLENTVSEGIVSAVREINETHIIQTTASISPGSSGGPLLNQFGKVIGLTTSQMVNGQNLNFVIASTHLTDLKNNPRQLTLAEMLSETRVSEDLVQSTIAVPAQRAAWMRFNVNGQQGAVLEGSYSVTGGGNDVNVKLVAQPNTVLVDSGRVTRYGQFKQRLPRGSYTILFDNGFSLFTTKSVSPELKRVYYR